MALALSPSSCSGLILAGGAGRRMGDHDKGLLPWNGGILAGHAAQRLARGGLPVWLSANRNLDRYGALGLPLVQDRRAGFQGPLAALEAGLYAVTTPWLLAVPCDSPLFPETLAERLWSAIQPSSTSDPLAPAAYACCGDHRHPVFCLVARALAPALTRFLDAGGRRVGEWWEAVGAATVDFGADAEPAFANANSPEDYRALCERAAGGDPAC